MKIKNVAIDTVIPYARNPRNNQGAISKVAGSIKEFGWQQPIVVDSEMVVIAGHTRLAAAQSLEMDKVPIVVAENLTPAQVKAYRLADNRVSQEAEWDHDLLTLELQDLVGEEYDLDLTGFSDDELAALLAEETEGLTDEDAVPDVPENPVTVLGDVWLLGDHRLMCGDSTSIDAVEKLMGGVTPNAIVTDPPYGIGIDGQKRSISKNPKHNRKAHEFRGWDNERPSAEVFQYVVGVGVPAVIWGGNYFADLLPPTRGWLYWSKGQDGLTMSDGELAWTTEDKPLRAKTVNRNALKGSVHPTQKPVEIYSFSINFLQVPQKGAVLDLFGGSGSLLISCEQTDKRAFAMELDPKYCDVIVKRWQDFTGKKAVHAETGEEFNG
jgi:DNA modification methylase